MDDRATLLYRLERGEWLTPPEVAAVTGASRSTVHRWLAATPPKIRFRTRPFSTWRECNPEDVREVLNEQDTAGR